MHVLVGTPEFLGRGAVGGNLRLQNVRACPWPNARSAHADGAHADDGSAAAHQLPNWLPRIGSDRIGSDRPTGCHGSDRIGSDRIGSPNWLPRLAPCPSRTTEATCTSCAHRVQVRGIVIDEADACFTDHSEQMAKLFNSMAEARNAFNVPPPQTLLAGASLSPALVGRAEEQGWVRAPASLWTRPDRRSMDARGWPPRWPPRWPTARPPQLR